jgi:hypothetical protein
LNMHDLYFYLNKNGNFPIFFNAIPVPWQRNAKDLPKYGKGC